MKQGNEKERVSDKIIRNFLSSAYTTLILLLILAFIGSSIYIGFSSFMSK